MDIKNNQKMTNQKIPTLSGTVILVIIAVTVFSFVWKYRAIKSQTDTQIENITTQKSVKSKQKDPQEKLTTSAIIDNSLYKNIKYNYQLEIPANLKSESGSVNDPDSLIRLLSSKNNQLLFSIYVENSNSKNIDDWLSGYRKKISTMTSYEGVPVNPPRILSTKKIFIDSVAAIRVVMENMPYSDYFIVFIKNGLVYNISYSGLLEENERELLKSKPDEYNSLLSEFHLKHRLELDKIAESFKFIR